jgi:hypothetical protein
MRAPRATVLALGCAALGCALPSCDARGRVAADAPPAPGASASASARASAPRPPGFLKGQLHAHTSGSGDSDTDPAEAAAWYAARGYDFVVFTDHNVVTEAPPPPGMLLLRGVELTQNLRDCEPPPEPGDACLLHVNALFVAPRREPIRWEPLPGAARVALYGRALDRAAQLGGVAQLDHPNFQHGAGLDVVLALAGRGLGLMEIANEAVDSGNDGDAAHPATEALWDAALARGAVVYGTATDDAHHYDDAARVRARGETAYTGDRGFVMVRAARDPAAIRAAVVAGDFYASTGVILERVALAPDAVDLEVRAEHPPYTFEIVTGGRVTRAVSGPALRFDPRAEPPGVVRVRVTDGRGGHAWTQPVRR